MVPFTCIELGYFNGTFRHVSLKTLEKQYGALPWPSKFRRSWA